MQVVAAVSAAPYELAPAVASEPNKIAIPRVPGDDSNAILMTIVSGTESSGIATRA